MKLYLYRISLTEQDQGGLFADRRRISRLAFLSEQFGNSFHFSPRKNISLRYQVTQQDDEIIAGAVCRWVSDDAEADPDDPFITVEGGRWLKAAFFLNIERHQQVIGIEHNNRVASPASILEGLADYLNNRTESYPYIIEIKELNKKGSFYDAVNSYPGPVTSIKFRFIVPNPPDVEREVREALRKLGKRTGADEAIEVLKSRNGLNIDSDYVNDAVDYVEDGGGDVVAKDGGNKVYDSSSYVRTTEVSDDLAPNGTPIRNLSKFVKGLLRKK